MKTNTLIKEVIAIKTIRTATLKKWLSSFFNKRVGMFLLFLFIAAVVWMVNHLSSDCQAQLSFNVCVYNSQNSKSSNMCTDEPVDVIAKASGFNIMSKRLSKRPTVYVDIKDQRMLKTGSQSYLLTTTLLTITLKNHIDQQLGVKTESYVQDTIFFHKVDEIAIPATGVDYGQESSGFGHDAIRD